MVTWGPGTKNLQDWGLSHPILPVSSPAKVLSKSEGNLEGGVKKGSDSASYSPGTNCRIHVSGL